jgi:hypothetical protein
VARQTANVRVRHSTRGDDVIQKQQVLLSTAAVFLRSVFRLLATANVVPSSPILVTLMMEAIYSPETSILTRAALRNVPEDGIHIIQPLSFAYPPM